MSDIVSKIFRAASGSDASLRTSFSAARLIASALSITARVHRHVGLALSDVGRVAERRQLLS